MSRWTKRAYLRLCAEKQQKKDSGGKGLMTSKKTFLLFIYLFIFIIIFFFVE